jgi:hypothetical protein
MTSEWQHFARSMRVNNDWITVALDRGREHDVQVLEHPDGWEVSGPAADSETLTEAGLTHTKLWEWNRYEDLIGYVIDEAGTAWVTAWMPKVGATAEEFEAVVREVAVEADRLEYYCSGRDEL